MEINNYKIISGRIIGEEKNERGLNAVYNIADLMQGNKIPIGYAKIENYPIHSGRMLSEEKDESGENKIFNIADILSDMVPASELGELAYKDSASGDYTPQGTVSNPELLAVGQRTDLPVIGTVGQLPSLTYDGETETLTFNPGSLPTEGTYTLNYITNVALGEPPVFTGTPATITVE